MSCSRYENNKANQRKQETMHTQEVSSSFLLLTPFQLALLQLGLGELGVRAEAFSLRLLEACVLSAAGSIFFKDNTVRH